jgi:hypothetical protein
VSGISLGGLRHVIGFTGNESFDHFDILGEVVEDSYSWFLHEVLKVSTYSFGRVFLLEGVEEAGLDGIPASLVSSKGLQAVPPRLGLSLDDASQFLDLSLVIPSGDDGSNFDLLNESASGHGVLSFIPVK